MDGAEPAQARLGAYLARIGLAAAPQRSGAGLEQILAAHRRHIAFENYDVMLGRGVALDDAAVFAKLVSRGRGGYCFEQNALFGAMLAQMGFANRPLMARVWLAAEAGVVPMRGHTLRLVDLDGQPWIADAGFGGAYAPAMPLRDGACARTGDGAEHRLSLVGELGDVRHQWLLERRGPLAATDGRAQGESDWVAQYGFDLRHVAPVDLEMANFYVAHRPGGRFTTLNVGSIVLADGFVAMTDRRLRVYAGGKVDERDLPDAAAWLGAAQQWLKLAISAEEVAGLRLY